MIMNFHVNGQFAAIRPLANMHSYRGTISTSQASDDGSSQRQFFSAKDFYLASPTEVDCASVANLVKDGRFFFAPISNAIKGGVKPFTAAAHIVFGEHDTDVTKVARLKKDNSFLGCIRFTNVKNGEAELSYFFDPNYQGQRLGTQAVLRTIDWASDPNEGLDITKLYATVDPDNYASVKILQKAGLKVKKGGYALPEQTDYADEGGERRPRLVMRGRIKQDIEPALLEARNAGFYSLQTPVL